MLGSYEINVQVGKLPQKVATYFDDTMRKLLGAVYTPVAYLGSQMTNGTNHISTLHSITGTDTRNAVLVIVNEKDEGLSLVGITPVLESGDPLGGVNVDISTDLPADAKDAFDKEFSTFLGSNIQPFALLGEQVVNGVNYFFLAEVSAIVGTSGSVIGGNTTKIALIEVSARAGTVKFHDVLE